MIADHIRSCSFMITDGVIPSNEGRGYVLRRIIRRAARHGNKLGITEPFFYKLVQPLVDNMGSAYSELVDAQQRVEKVLETEELRFNETLHQGMRILQDDIKSLSGDTISGETVFKLYDTYGFPADLTADVAREQNLKIDESGFQKQMEAQRERGRQASRFDVDYDASLRCKPFRIYGYEYIEGEGVVKEIFVNNESVKTIKEGESGLVILDQTPFYAESGGQVGDQGLLTNKQASFVVTDTQKQGNAHAHIGKQSSGTLKVGDQVSALADAVRRQAVVLNHSATHLMHAALREVLGNMFNKKARWLRRIVCVLIFHMMHRSVISDLAAN